MAELRSKQRIKKRIEIARVRSIGNRWRGQQLTIWALSNEREYDRLAVIVSRCHGSAVQRNYLKRSIREIFRGSRARTSSFYDIVIKPVKAAAFLRREAEGDFLLWQRRQRKG